MLQCEDVLKAADHIERMEAERDALRDALKPFAMAWGIASATGITRMAYLADIARGEVAGVHFQCARAALGKAKP